MLAVSLCMAAAFMMAVGGTGRLVYLWVNRHQIRAELIQSRLAELRHEADMIGLEDALRMPLSK